MLDYRRNRLDYGDQLIPPPGYVLARAVAATYSLDLSTLLSIPVALFYAQTLEGIETEERLQLLEAIQRCPEILRIYHQAGQIHVPRAHNRLYGLLEECVVGVLLENDYSSFHPKVWILRFEPEKGPARYRVIVLSRNLTYDRSWDIAASIEGEVSGRLESRNAPLVAFARFLLGRQAFDGSATFLDDLARVAFAPPSGFREFRFLPLGLGICASPFETTRADRLVWISPFVQDAALERFRRTVSGERWLFGRREELRQLDPATLEGFHAYALSDLVVDGESLTGAEDGEGEQLQQNLHAKLFVFKRGGRTNTWFLGSTNATAAAFERNVEFLLELHGSGDAVQLERLLQDLLGRDGDAGVFEAFVPPDHPVDEAAVRALEQRVRHLQWDLLHALKLTRAALERSANGVNYDLVLAFAAEGLRWADLEVRIAPFNSEHRPLPLPRTDEGELRFENINESSLSRFLHLQILHEGECVRSFLVKIEIAGMPPGRVSAIIRGIVNSSDRFFEYLGFLLAPDFNKDTIAGDGEIQGAREVDAGDALWGAESSIFEQLLITASRRPKRLKDIDELIAQLRDARDEDGGEIVPESFLLFWNAFRKATPRVPGGAR